MTTMTISQAAYRLDFGWEFGDPVSLSFVVEAENLAGTYECVVRDSERGGKVLAAPTVTATYIPNDGTNFEVQLTDSTEVPIGRWWFAITEVNGVTRFSGRVQVGDARLGTIAYTSVLDSSGQASSDLVEAVS